VKKNLHYTIGLLLLFSLFLFTLLRLYLEIRDIWRPGAGLAGTRDSMAQIRDIPGNPGRAATLITAEISFVEAMAHAGVGKLCATVKRISLTSVLVLVI